MFFLPHSLKKVIEMEHFGLVDSVIKNQEFVKVAFTFGWVFCEYEQLKYLLLTWTKL